MGHLTLVQRYTIQVLLKDGLNQSLIAKRLNRDKSVIQREIKRNCDLRSGEYKADLADKKCSNRHKTKNKQIRFTTDIKYFTESLIREDYSPEQIVGVAKLQGKECVSIDRINIYGKIRNKEQCCIRNLEPRVNAIEKEVQMKITLVF